MRQKHTIRLGKFLLLMGLGLCALVIFEAHRDMVGATVLDTLTPAPPAQVQGMPPVASPVTPPSPRTTLEAAPQPASPRTATETRSPAQPLALNVGQPGDEARNIAQVNPNQIAANQWYGASFPVEQFQAYTSPFGYRTSPTGGYTREFHYGLDLAAPEGSYIRNWWSGTVVEVTDNSNCGTSVVVESGSWIHIYCHMQGHVEVAGGKRYMIDRSGGLQIFEGQPILAGERIGRVGMTGRTTGPHLHWGLKFNNNWVDPALVLRAMYSEQRNAARPTNAQ